MSSYSASTIQIDTVGRILQQINASGCTFFNLSRRVLTSLEFSAAVAEFGTANTMPDLQTDWASLSALPGAVDMLEQAAPDEIAAFMTLQSELECSQPLDGSANAVLLQNATDHLDAALNTTIDLLRADERAVTSFALKTALTELGYTVTPKLGDAVTAIAAYKDDHVLAAVVSDGGTAEIDVAGLVGDDCAGPLTALDNALQDLGVQLKIERRTDHGDRTGGTLIQRAAAANWVDLAAGLVASAETASGANPAVKPRGARRRRAQVVGGAS